MLHLACQPRVSPRCLSPALPVLGLAALVQQVKPDDGTNATIGALGVTRDGPVAMDMASTADGSATAIRDIAVLPAM